MSESLTNEQIRVYVADGKYTIVLDGTFGLRALRHGEPWRDCTGDGLIYSLACELEASRERCLSAEERLERATKLLEELLETHNNCGIDEVPYGYGKVIDSVQAFLDRPKAIRPPAPCAPPAVTDVVPDVCGSCGGRGGWDGGFNGESWAECPRCNP